MEKYFQAVQPDASIKADRILELNVEHPAFQALEAAVEADPARPVSASTAWETWDFARPRSSVTSRAVSWPGRRKN